jgi:hypothetical protein
VCVIQEDENLRRGCQVGEDDLSAGESSTSPPTGACRSWRERAICLGIRRVSRPSSPQAVGSTLVAHPREAPRRAFLTDPMRRGQAVLGDGRRTAMRRGVVARRCSCGSFWQKGALACGRCGSGAFSSWGFYVDTHEASRDGPRPSALDSDRRTRPNASCWSS